MKVIRFIIKITILLGLLYLWINYNNDKMAEEASPLLYSDISKVPTKNVALVLGTTKFLKGGRRNYFFDNSTP